MKKHSIIAFVVAALLAFAPVSFASVGVQQDGVEKGQAATFNFTDGLTQSGNGPTRDIGLSGIGEELDINGRGRNNTFVKASSSTPIDANELSYAVILKNVGHTGVDSTGSILPDGEDGQEITFIITGLISGGTWKLTPTTKTGFNFLTFDAKGDSATLQFLSGAGWVIKATNSVTINQA